MKNIFIPTQFLKRVRVKSLKGQWIEGEWVENAAETRIIKAVFMPVNPRDLKNYPQGFITLEDMDLRTKEDLELGDIVEINGKEWKIFQKLDYGYIADLKFYILKRSDKDD